MTNDERSLLWGKLFAYAVATERLHQTKHMLDHDNRFHRLPATTYMKYWTKNMSEISSWLTVSESPYIMLFRKWEREIDAIIDELGTEGFTDDKLTPMYLVGKAKESLKLDKELTQFTKKVNAESKAN